MIKLIGIVLLLLCFGFAKAQLTMKKADGGILIVDGQNNVLQFQTEPKSKDGKFERCNYIHPLWGLDGQVLTEDFPADHPHHRGVFWTWHQVWIGDNQIGDPWIVEDFDQEVVELEFMKNPNGTVQIVTEVDWKSNKWKKGGEKVPYLKEYTNITVNPKQGNYRKIDFEIKLQALEQDLKIGGSQDRKGYSGFSVRMIMPDDIKFSGPKGDVTPQLLQVKSKGYINVSGSFGANNNNGGIVIVDNPTNPDYPQPWILRAKNSCQNAAWPGSEAVELSVTEPLVLKYSLLIYVGKMNHKKITKALK